MEMPMRLLTAMLLLFTFAVPTLAQDRSDAPPQEQGETQEERGDRNGRGGRRNEGRPDAPRGERGRGQGGRGERGRGGRGRGRGRGGDAQDQGPRKPRQEPRDQQGRGDRKPGARGRGGEAKVDRGAMARQMIMMRRMAAMRSQGMQSMAPGARGGFRPQASKRMQGAWRQRAEAMRGAGRRGAMRQV